MLALFSLSSQPVTSCLLASRKCCVDRLRPPVFRELGTGRPDLSYPSRKGKKGGQATFRIQPWPPSSSAAPDPWIVAVDPA